MQPALLPSLNRSDHFLTSLPVCERPSASTMATSAAALRSKMFSGPAVTAPANTEGLRQATDALLRQQANAESTVHLYRTKLGEAQAAVAKLQAAYVEQAQLNGRLQGARQGPSQGWRRRPNSTADRRRAAAMHPPPAPPPPPLHPAAKVKNDHESLTKLQTAVLSTAAAYTKLNDERRALAQELAAAEQERTALATAFMNKAADQAGLEQALAAACKAAKDLQGRLHAAAAVHATMTADLAAARGEAADKVGGGLLGWLWLGLGRRLSTTVLVPHSSQHQHPPAAGSAQVLSTHPPPTLRRTAPPPSLAHTRPACIPALALDPLQAKELAAAERRAAQLGADLTTVGKERDGLAAQLTTATGQLEQAKQDLAAKTTLLEEEQGAKVGGWCGGASCDRFGATEAALVGG